MELLTAFVREYAPATDARSEVAALDDKTRDDARAGPRARPPLRTDLQAVATVLGRRDVTHDPDGYRLDLHAARLDGADFHGAQLVDADFTRARLYAANFQSAQLSCADFYGAQLGFADFQQAQLDDASFVGARADGAHFSEAQLQRANTS